MFHILATLTKSFDESHYNHGSDGSKKLHLIASTAVLPGTFNLGLFAQALEKDGRKKKTLIIEVSQLFNKDSEFVDINEDYLKNYFISWDQLKTTIDESGKGSYMNLEHFSYLKLDFNYFISILNNDVSLNLFSNILGIKDGEQRKIEHLYNQFLFVFDNILWNDVVMKLKINNIEVSGGTTTTRHVLSTTEILLNYYLNLMFDFDIEKILSIGYDSYKNSKEILSSQIPLKLYKIYLNNNEEILDTNPELLYDKLLTIYGFCSENTQSSNTNEGKRVIKPHEDKQLKIIANNLLTSRRTIIRTMSLHQEKILIKDLERKIDLKKTEVENLRLKYDTGMPLISSRKQRKLALKEMKREMLNTNLDQHYEKLNNMDLELQKLELDLVKNKEELTNYIEGLKKLTFIKLFNKFEEIRGKINYNDTINSTNKLFKKYKAPRSSERDEHGVVKIGIRRYSSFSIRRLSYKAVDRGERYIESVLIEKNSVESERVNDSISGAVSRKIVLSGNASYQLSQKGLNKIFGGGQRYKNRILFYSRIEEIFRDVNNIGREKSQIKLENLLYNLEYKELSKGEFRFNILEDLDNLSIDIKNFIIDKKDKIFKLCDNLRENSKLRKLDIKNIDENADNNEIILSYLSNILENVDNTSIYNILIYILFNIINNSNTGNKNLNSQTQIIKLVVNKLYKLFLYKLYLIESKNTKKDSKLYKEDGSVINNLPDLEDIFYFNWKKNKMDLISILNDTSIQHFIGSKLIEFLYITNCVKLTKIKLGDNEQYCYDVTDTFSNLLSKNDEGMTINPLIYPEKLPMIAKPKRFERLKIKKEDGTIETIEKLGGFYLNNLYNHEEIVINNWRLKYPSRVADSNLIYEGINNMSGVGFKINKEVLNFVIEFNLEYDLTLIEKIHPLEIKKSEKKKLTSKESRELESFISRRSVDDSIMGLAHAYSLLEEFFIPLRLDYRGRIYCSSSYLNYQSTELAKALLLFSKSDKIFKTDKNSINYLKIYGANCYGNQIEKMSGNERIKWVEDNTYDILNFENGKLLKQADSKLLFIAFCFEYRRINIELNNGSIYYNTFLPIQLDATCNGFQHISMLGSDEILSQNLNIKESSFSDVPDDFYSILGIMVKEMISNYIKSNEHNENINLDAYIRLNNLNLNRKILKKCIMTIPYNASRIQAIRYLRDQFYFDDEETIKRNKILGIKKHVLKKVIDNIKKIEDKNKMEENNLKILSKETETETETYINQIENNDNLIDNDISEKDNLERWWKYKKNPDLKLESKDFDIIYKFLIDILFKIAPSLNEISTYLKQIALICSTANTYIPWTLPTGIEVRQSYMEIKNYRISPFNYAKYSFNLKVVDEDKIDNRKQMAAFMPNLIHSLDAASLALLLHEYFNDNNITVKNIFSIHDCFAVTANNMEYVINLLKASYMLLYSQKKYITELDSNIRNHIITFIDPDFNNPSNTDNIVKVTVSEKNIIKVKKFKYPDIKKILSSDFDISKSIKNSCYILN